MTGREIDHETVLRWMTAAETVAFTSVAAVQRRRDMPASAVVAMLADLARAAADVAAYARDEQQRIADEVLELRAALGIDGGGEQ